MTDEIPLEVMQVWGRCEWERTYRMAGMTNWILKLLE